MKLKVLEVNAFGGISPTAPVILDFSQSKWVNASGDNGVNKTSLINSLLVACGALSKENKNFINNDSGKIDINFSFVGNDRLTYEVRCTKSQFQLTYEGEALPEPLTKMKELLGVVGVSPMDIKNKPLKEQLRWVASYSTRNVEEFEADLLKIKNGMKSAREGRAAANKSYKSLKELLDNEPMFNKYEESEKKYSKPVDIKKLSAQLDEVGKKSDKLIQAEEKLKQLTSRETALMKQIEDLQRELATTQTSIKNGKKFIEENKGAKKEYDDIKSQYDTAAAEASKFHQWQNLKRQAGEMNEFETMSQKFDAREKELIEQQKTLQADILPNVKGLEIVMEDTHEDGVARKEGLYWNGKTMAQLSESEFWAIIMDIWKKNKVRIVVIDNFQSLGTLAVGMLEKLHKDGCYVLTAEMRRESKELQISYQ